MIVVQIRLQNFWRRKIGERDQNWRARTLVWIREMKEHTSCKNQEVARIVYMKRHRFESLAREI